MQIVCTKPRFYLTDGSYLGTIYYLDFVCLFFLFATLYQSITLIKTICLTKHTKKNRSRKKMKTKMGERCTNS